MCFHYLFLLFWWRLHQTAGWCLEENGHRWLKGFFFFFFGEQSERVRGERWEAFCQMMDSQRLNDLCTLLKRQTGCLVLSASIYLSFLKPLPKQALYEKGTHWVWWHHGSPQQILVMVMCACGGLKVKQEVSSNKILPVQQEMSSWLNNEAVGPDGSKSHHVSFLRCLCIRFILHGASVSQMRVTVVCSHMLNGVSLHKDPVIGSVIQVEWRININSITTAL